MQGGKVGFFKRVGRVVRKGAKKVNKGLKKAGKFIKKNEALRRGVMAARRGIDYGIKFVPIVGNVYNVADYGVRGARAARRGKLKKFLATEGIKGLVSSIAPEAYAAAEYKQAQVGVANALMRGKGHCPCPTTKTTVVARRRRRNM